MAWNEEIIPLTRGLIGDIDLDTPTYSDSTIQQYIIYAAHFILSELDFPTPYVVDMSQQTIMPDPTTPTRDTSFINVVALKAALFVLNGEIKAATSQAVRITDGPSSIDMTAIYKAKLELLKQLQINLDQIVLAISIGDFSAGQAILSPYTQLNENYYSHYPR